MAPSAIELRPKRILSGCGQGIRSRLGYLRELGVDAIWITPWYPSPMDDGGYDVADFRDIEPLFGTLAEAEELIAEAHARDIRVIIDIVPNHCSDEHRWFQAALAAGPGSPERQRFWFRPGSGSDGEPCPRSSRRRRGSDRGANMAGERSSTASQQFARCVVNG